MSGSVPVTLGRWVHYRLDQDDVDKIALARTRIFDSDRGNPATAGDTYPALVVHVDRMSETVNLQVHLDGPDVHWVTSVIQWPEDASGQTESHTGVWFWPPRVGD